MKRKKIPIYIGAGALFFIFLLYNLFPYFLLKEVLINEIQVNLQKSQLHFYVDAESLKPYWFTGVEFKNVHLNEVQNSVPPILIDKLNARISVFPLLIGDLKINSTLVQKDGSADLSFSLPLFSALFGTPHLKRAEVHFSKFPIDDLISQMRVSLGNKKDTTTAFLYPVISNATAGGYLNGDVDFINTGSKKSSKIDLAIENGYLNINNHNLNIPKQNFSAAGVHMTWDGNSLVVQKGSKFVAQNISFDASGSLTSSGADNVPLQANLNLNIKLSGEMEKNFGFLLPQILRCPAGVVSGGSMNIQLIGPVNNLVCQ
jgi:type II secretion system protein N